MRPEEARTFLEIQRAAVRGLASKHYSKEIIEEWAELPITDEALERFNANSDGEVRLMAEMNGEPVGIGALVVTNSELRACYVLPSAVRQGVGTAIVREIEKLGRKHGLTHLQLHASINAEHFYLALGYTVLKRTEHVLRSGGRMQSVEMRKRLATRPHS
jgi:putative acetyltransferase